MSTFKEFGAPPVTSDLLLDILEFLGQSIQVKTMRLLAAAKSNGRNCKSVKRREEIEEEDSQDSVDRLLQKEENLEISDDEEDQPLHSYKPQMLNTQKQPKRSHNSKKGYESEYPPCRSSNSMLNSRNSFDLTDDQDFDDLPSVNISNSKFDKSKTQPIDIDFNRNTATKFSRRKVAESDDNNTEELQIPNSLKKVKTEKKEDVKMEERNIYYVSSDSDTSPEKKKQKNRSVKNEGVQFVSVKKEVHQKSSPLLEITNTPKTHSTSTSFETSRSTLLTLNAAVQTSPEVQNFGVQVSPKKASVGVQTETVKEDRKTQALIGIANNVFETNETLISVRDLLTRWINIPFVIAEDKPGESNESSNEVPVETQQL